MNEEDASGGMMQRHGDFAQNFRQVDLLPEEKNFSNQDSRLTLDFKFDEYPIIEQFINEEEERTKYREVQDNTELSAETSTTKYSATKRYDPKHRALAQAFRNKDNFQDTDGYSYNISQAESNIPRLNQPESSIPRLRQHTDSSQINLMSREKPPAMAQCSENSVNIKPQEQMGFEPMPGIVERGDLNCKVDQQLNPSQCQYAAPDNVSTSDAQLTPTSDPTQCFYASSNQDCNVGVENCGQYCSREVKEKENQSTVLEPPSPPKSPPKSSLLSSCVQVLIGFSHFIKFSTV